MPNDKKVSLNFPNGKDANAPVVPIKSVGEIFRNIAAQTHSLSNKPVGRSDSVQPLSTHLGVRGSIQQAQDDTKRDAQFYHRNTINANELAQDKKGVSAQMYAAQQAIISTLAQATSKIRDAKQDNNSALYKQRKQYYEEYNAGRKQLDALQDKDFAWWDVFGAIGNAMDVSDTQDSIMATANDIEMVNETLNKNDAVAARKLKEYYTSTIMPTVQLYQAKVTHLNKLFSLTKGQLDRNVKDSNTRMLAAKYIAQSDLRDFQVGRALKKQETQDNLAKVWLALQGKPQTDDNIRSAGTYISVLGKADPKKIAALAHLSVFAQTIRNKTGEYPDGESLVTVSTQGVSVGEAMRIYNMMPVGSQAKNAGILGVVTTAINSGAVNKLRQQAVEQGVTSEAADKITSAATYRAQLQEAGVQVSAKDAVSEFNLLKRKQLQGYNNQSLSTFMENQAPAYVMRAIDSNSVGSLVNPELIGTADWVNDIAAQGIPKDVVVNVADSPEFQNIVSQPVTSPKQLAQKASDMYSYLTSDASGLTDEQAGKVLSRTFTLSATAQAEQNPKLSGLAAYRSITGNRVAIPAQIPVSDFAGTFAFGTDSALANIIQDAFPSGVINFSNPSDVRKFMRAQARAEKQVQQVRSASGISSSSVGAAQALSDLVDFIQE